MIPSETILYVAIATKGGSKSKNDLHLNESFWKELSDESKDNLFSCSPCRDIQGWNWRNRDQKFWKRSRGLSQRTRVWIGFFHPKFPSLYAVYSATLFELYFVMHCSMNVHNIPYGNFHYWEYRKILIVDFLCNYKEDLFSGHFVYKLENEEIYTEQIFFLPFHRLWNVLRPKKWWKRRLKNVNQLDIRKFTNVC